MKVVSFNQENFEHFDAFVLEQAGNFQQSFSWGVFQKKVRGRFFALGVEKSGKLVASALFIRHELPFGMCWLNCPRGPVFRGQKSDRLSDRPISDMGEAPQSSKSQPSEFQLSESEKRHVWEILFHEIRFIAKKEKAIFLRLEPDEYEKKGRALDATLCDKAHPWAKVTEFKLKFGGEVVQYHPPIEYVFHSFWYWLMIGTKCVRSFFCGSKKRESFESMSSFWKLAGFRIAGSSYQPLFTNRIDLRFSDSEILDQMKPKGRYNIRLSEKKGLTVLAWPSNSSFPLASHPVSKNAVLDAFFSLLQETTQRDRFSGHDRKFYADFLEILGNRGLAKLYLAKNGDTFLAGILVTFFAGSATYFYGASSDSHRELMAPYLLQWVAMKEARKRGCRVYDFFGVSPVALF
ncbi:peptidoglycan bridge formation glycyltransferase FemA/FemB family protein [Candidatus Peregrinibacteria bacterium]|nr:peptidoglycan bridge formation glycyltransferase FemA/FemB family protein [Candidatus Peregrinibacteria bacterium]